MSAYTITPRYWASTDHTPENIAFWTVEGPGIRAECKVKAQAEIIVKALEEEKEKR